MHSFKLELGGENEKGDYKGDNEDGDDRTRTKQRDEDDKTFGSMSMCLKKFCNMYLWYYGYDDHV